MGQQQSTDTELVELKTPRFCPNCGKSILCRYIIRGMVSCEHCKAQFASTILLPVDKDQE